MTKREKIDALKKTIKYTHKYMPDYSFGLCSVIRITQYSQEISIEEYDYISGLIVKEKSQHPNSLYYWELGVKTPRIKWLKEQIKLLENK